jgi:hypothetical protein
MFNQNKLYYNKSYNIQSQCGEGNRYKGENHAPLKIGNKIKIAEYCGPNTDIVKRAELNIKPLSVVDLISAIHDCDYYLAQLAPNKEEQLRMVRNADNKMLKRLTLASKKKLDNVLNISAGKIGIGLKTKIEDRGKIIGALGGLVMGGVIGALKGFWVGRKAKQKLNNIAGELVQHPKKDIEIIRNFKQKKLNELNKLIGQTGDGILDDIWTFFTGKKPPPPIIKIESSEDEEEYEEYESDEEYEGDGFFGSLGKIISQIVDLMFGKTDNEKTDDIKETVKKSCLDVLKEHNIETVRDFNKWALKGGHPDKGGDTAIFQEVSDCVDKRLKGKGFFDKAKKKIKKEGTKILKKGKKELESGLENIKGLFGETKKQKKARLKREDLERKEEEKRIRKKWTERKKECKMRDMDHRYGNMYGEVGNCYPKD